MPSSFHKSVRAFDAEDGTRSGHRGVHVLQKHLLPPMKQA
jgi:hypothetical protein